MGLSLQCYIFYHSGGALEEESFMPSGITNLICKYLSQFIVSGKYFYRTPQLSKIGSFCCVTPYNDEGKGEREEKASWQKVLKLTLSL